MYGDGQPPVGNDGTVRVGCWVGAVASPPTTNNGQLLAAGLSETAASCRLEGGSCTCRLDAAYDVGERHCHIALAYDPSPPEPLVGWPSVAVEGFSSSGRDAPPLHVGTSGRSACVGMSDGVRCYGIAVSGAPLLSYPTSDIPTHPVGAANPNRRWRSDRQTDSRCGTATPMRLFACRVVHQHTQRHANAER